MPSDRSPPLRRCFVIRPRAARDKVPCGTESTPKPLSKAKNMTRLPIRPRAALACLVALLLPLGLADPLCAQVQFRPLRASWANGLEVAVVQRARGKHLAFSIEKVEDGSVAVPKLPDEDARGRVMVFLVPGLRSIEDFDAFLEQPSSREWAQIHLELGSGARRRRVRVPLGRARAPRTPRSAVIPAKTEVLAHGKIVGFDDAHFERVDIRAHLLRGDTQIRAILMPAYDPCTGRFWIQALPVRERAPVTDFDALRIDVDPNRNSRTRGRGPVPKYAALHSVKFKRGERRSLRLPKAGGAKFVFPQLSKPSLSSVFRVALRDVKSGVRIARPFYRGGVADFRGLASGVYELDLACGGRVIKTWKDLRVDVGKTLLMDSIDLSDLLHEVRIEIVGDFKRVQLERGDLAGGQSGSTSNYRSASPLLVPHGGYPVVIRAPSDEYCARLIPKLDRDLKIQLEVAKTLRVALDISDELRQEPALFRDLYVVMEPAQDPYPDWAWSYFSRKSMFQRARGANRPTTAHAAVSAKERSVEVRVPFAGAWRLHWAYMRRGILKKVDSPFPNETGIERDGQELTLGLPASQLRKAHKAFVAARR